MATEQDQILVETHRQPTAILWKWQAGGLYFMVTHHMGGDFKWCVMTDVEVVVQGASFDARGAVNSASIEAANWLLAQNVGAQPVLAIVAASLAVCQEIDRMVR